MRQHTLQRTVETSGIGLHSAQPVRLVLHPAAADSGIVFRRVDLSPPAEVPARPEAVRDTRLATTLQVGEVRIVTVEHLLAALSGMGVDNAVIELDAAEVPIMDGSAAPFVQLIRSAGLRAQPTPRSFLRIKQEVGVADGDKQARFLPHAGYRLSFTIDFKQPVFQGLTTHAQMDYSVPHFVEAVSRARTFGFLHEVEYLRSHGLALGGSFDNAVVVDDYRVLNKEGLRSEDEFVQHKILDAMGDLCLLGHPLIGEYRAYKAGHTLNHAAIRALLARPQAWEIVTFGESGQAPACYAEDVN